MPPETQLQTLERRVRECESHIAEQKAIVAVTASHRSSVREARAVLAILEDSLAALKLNLRVLRDSKA